MLPFVLGALGMVTGAALEAANAAEKEPEQYTVKQVADRLNVSELTIKRRIKKGELKADIVDGKYIISRDELRRFMDTFPAFSQKENLLQEKTLAYDSKELVHEAIKTLKDKIEENPEICQDFIKRCELSKQEIDIKLQIIDLDKKIFKDDAKLLKELEDKKYNCEFKKVQGDNDINTLKFMLYKANRQQKN